MIEIKLTPNQVTIIDDIDAGIVNTKDKWYAHLQKNYRGGGKYIAARRFRNANGGRTLESMHRVILERVLNRKLERHELVDHKNGDPLDNRRENLRLATPQQNTHNRGINPRNRCGFKGVMWRKDRNKWLAKITISGQFIHLGLFEDILDAAKAYNEAAIKYFGEFANLNDLDNSEG